MPIETSTHPLARKSHRCDQCGRAINPGERYHRWEQASDYSSGIETWKTCDQCRRLELDLWAVGVRGENDYGAECYVHLPELFRNGYDLPTSEPWPTRFALLEASWHTPEGLLAAYPEDGV